MKLFKAYRRNPGDGKPLGKEELICDVKFYKHKFNNRPIPKDKKRVLFITCFSEFGCESIGLMYCIPKILQRYPGMYVICVGWYGRQYLYKHLVDEYWEIGEEFQWLREYVQAFKNDSKNLAKIESYLGGLGVLFKCADMGKICLGNTCLDCKCFWGDEKSNVVCPKCSSDNIERSLLANIDYHKKFALNIPKPSQKVLVEARKYLKPNPVGIFARGRACYGRNLRSEFYVKLIKNLEEMGYNPIWLGEKQSVLPCPVGHVIDFSRMSESRNLELTLAIVSQLKFTVQFWTASTRLASMMGTNWILFESSDQLYGAGQEGKRIALTTDFDKKKIIVSHYHDVMENEEAALGLVDRAILEMEQDNWDDIVGSGAAPEILKMQVKNKNIWNLNEFSS